MVRARKKLPKPKAGASLRYNTEIRDLIRRFYKKIPNEEIARMVMRITGEPCEPGYIKYLARPEQMPALDIARKRPKLTRGRQPIADADNAETREAGKNAINNAVGSLTDKEREEAGVGVV